MKKGALLAALGVLASSSMAGMVTFDNDTTGFGLPNGWQSVESTNLSFSDSEFEDLYLIPFDEFYGSNALAVNFDGIVDPVFGEFPDSSFLIVESDVKLRKFGADLANDKPLFTADGDYWQLRAFDGGTLVGTTTLFMDRDFIDANDPALQGYGTQRIEFELAAGFDRVEIEAFTTPTDYIFPGDTFPTTITSIQEVVDNVSYEPVPEPATMAVLGLGLAAAARRRRK